MYEIIVKKTVTTCKVLPKKWEPLERNGDKVEYGHTPEVETLQTETTEVYTQVVEELDLVALINAVNKGGG